MKTTMKDICNFLLASTFGRDNYRSLLKPGVIEDDVITACRLRAWRDACSRVSTSAPVQTATAEDICKDPRVLEIFREYIQAPGTRTATGAGYCKATVLHNHYDELMRILGQNRNVGGLGYGHLQKWFNMAVKYYYVLWVKRDRIGLDGVLKNYPFDEADCPVDSVILAALQADCKKQGLPAKNCNGKGCCHVSWSKMTEDDYRQIQECIGALTSGCNLDYDFQNW